VTTFILEWSSAAQKAAKLTVVPLQTNFEFMGLPLKKLLVSFRNEMFPIFRVSEFIVHRTWRAPLFQMMPKYRAYVIGVSRLPSGATTPMCCGVRSKICRSSVSCSRTFLPQFAVLGYLCSSRTLDDLSRVRSASGSCDA